MAPVPEDNKDIPSHDDSDNFFNPDLTIPISQSDSENSDDEDNFITPGGYSLLPQEPDDRGSDFEDTHIYNTDNVGDTDHTSSFQAEASHDLAEHNTSVSALTESALSPEEGATAPSVQAPNNTYHPAFLAKFPSGKIPSYMQVPRLPREKEEHLWNQQRQDSSKATLDSVHESKILKAMSHFSLPMENIPDWARGLSDDQWHQQVVSRIGITSGRHEQSTSAEHVAPPASGVESTVMQTAVADVWVADFTDDCSGTDTK